MLVYLRDKLNLTGKTTFSRSELSQLLSVYGLRVQKGIWKDYAIDHLSGMAVFSIYRSSQELPLYSVTKTSTRNLVKPAQYAIYAGEECLKKSTSLLEIIELLEKQK